MTTRTFAAFLLGLVLSGCGGKDASDETDGSSPSESESESEAFWQPAEGTWVTAERAISTDCAADISELNFAAQDEDALRCIELELDDYRGTLLLLGSDCENGIERLAASFELSEDGRMLASPLEYFTDGTSEYDCDYSRSQYELVLVDGEPYVVFWIEDASLEGVVECPDALPQNTEVTCLLSVYRLEAVASP